MLVETGRACRESCEKAQRRVQVQADGAHSESRERAQVEAGRVGTVRHGHVRAPAGGGTCKREVYPEANPTGQAHWSKAEGAQG